MPGETVRFGVRRMLQFVVVRAMRVETVSRYVYSPSFLVYVTKL